MAGVSYEHEFDLQLSGLRMYEMERKKERKSGDYGLLHFNNIVREWPSHI